MALHSSDTGAGGVNGVFMCATAAVTAACSSSNFRCGADADTNDDADTDTDTETETETDSAIPRSSAFTEDVTADSREDRYVLELSLSDEVETVLVVSVLSAFLVDNDSCCRKISLL